MGRGKLRAREFVANGFTFLSNTRACGCRHDFLPVSSHKLPANGSLAPSLGEYWCVSQNLRNRPARVRLPWDKAGFKEQDAQEEVAAKEAYKDGLRQLDYGF